MNGLAAEILEPLLRRVLASGEPVVDLPFTVDGVRADARRHFVASYWPVRDAAGGITGLVALVTERSVPQAALFEAQERLRGVAESGIVGLFFWSVDGGITEANDAFLRMLGYTRDDLAAGRVDWRRLTPPEYAERDEAAVRELLATGRHGQYAKEYVASDGRRVPVVVTSAMLEGSAERGVCICLDDSARREAEARLARVLRQTPAAIAVLLGPDHVMQSANEMFVRLLGRRDYVGRPARESAPELGAQGFLALMDTVYRTGVPCEGREAHLRWDRDGDGTLVEGYFDFIYQPLLDAGGAVEGVLVFAVEVTAQVRARAATELAARRTERLQTLTAALAGTRTVEDVAAVVVAQAVTATGARTGLLAVRPPGAADAVLVEQTGLSDDVLDALARISGSGPGAAARCLRTGAPQWAESRAEVLAQFPDAANVWESLGTHALATVPLEVAGPAGAPEVVGVMSYTFDAPRALPPEDREFFLALGRQAAQAVERARLLAAERAARGAAEAANRAKAEFLTTMSHELRTPLNAIQGHAQLIDIGIHGPVTQPQHDALGRIDRAQRHLLGLINDILNYAKIESGRVEYEVRPVAVADVVRDVVPMLEPQMAERGITLALQLPDASGGSPLLVWADREKLAQVLVNLLGNATKFTLPGGRVTVTIVERDDGSGPADRAYVQVRDTGVGIPGEKLEAVFEPFVQVRAADRSRGAARGTEGVGLGLSISRDLVRGMGGELRARSVEGAGSTFTVALRRVVTATGEPTDRRTVEERRLDDERRSGIDRREHEAGA
jgi:PAS domain S-box-containing protein